MKLHIFTFMLILAVFILQSCMPHSHRHLSNPNLNQEAVSLLLKEEMSMILAGDQLVYLDTILTYRDDYLIDRKLKYNCYGCTDKERFDSTTYVIPKHWLSKFVSTTYQENQRTDTNTYVYLSSLIYLGKKNLYGIQYYGYFTDEDTRFGICSLYSFKIIKNKIVEVSPRDQCITVLDIESDN